MARYQDILQTVGHTPVVKINRLAPDGIDLYVKVEAFNPLGSVKDRLALGVIEDAERRGVLKPGQTVIEATSGNTGIGLAMVCAARGYPLVVIMAENFSIERRRIMRFLGAQVVLTPAIQRGVGMLAKAVELAEAHGWFLCRQFENEANAEVHSRTTAQEILADFKDERLDYWVTGFGTGGTLKGVARVLKEQRPDTRIIVCEPDNSQMLRSGIAQASRPDGSPDGSHPNFRPHLMQGWAPDFIPRLTQDVVDLGLIDEIVPVNGDNVLRLTRELAQKEGIFAGISGGATLAGGLRIAASAPRGTTILCMLPDTGERYFTTPLFDDVPAEMTEEEFAISRSTPNYRFDTPACSISPQAAPAADQSTPEAEAFIAEVLADRSRPVVMFALEWCEFCWTVRRLFARFKVPFRDIVLDSVEYQEGNRGGNIRAALTARTSMKTIPQVFVGGNLVGGCSEVLSAFGDRGFQKALEESSVPFEESGDVDPQSFLPSWLHPR